MILVDSNIVVKAVNDLKFLSFIKQFNPVVCTVVNIEVIQGNKSNEDIKRLEKFIQLHFFRISNTRADLKMALELVRRLLKPFRHFAWRRNYRRNRPQPKPSALYLQYQAFPLF